MRHTSFLAICAQVLVCASCATAPVTPSGREGFFQKIAREGGDRRLPASAMNPEESGGERDAQLAPKSLKLQWPLKVVKVTSRFGRRGKEFHEGVDLHASVGTPVFAAERGTVIYAGHMIRGYGSMVVIRHAEGFATVYAHNSRLLVRRGQGVKRGQQVAFSGKSGHVRGPHLHFEIRSGVSAVDPLTLMPPARVVASER